MPCQQLANYIEFFSETSLDATRRYIKSEKFTVTLFPSYTPTIWFNLGSPYHLKTGQSWRLIDKNEDILLLRNIIVERNNLPTDNIFTIKFYPGGFESVFGISQAIIGSNVIGLTGLIPQPFIQRLKQLGTFEERILMLEQMLIENLDRRRNESPGLRCVTKVIETFCTSGMASNKEELARRSFLSDKTLYRYFVKVVGTNPKQYLSITRTRAALTAYVAGAKSFSPYDFGYYDMSHFYKDVVKFTGQKLSAHRS